ncbi:MAG: ferrous iron transport protein B [Proteobacteria bacterium]|nr:ferrous iron transport protein B [Pseudomonadota bacterium]
MRFLLVGQPNCGKSTLFNQIAGYKAIESNFPGTTVSYTESKFMLNNEAISIIDLPGTYTILPHDYAERVTRNYIFENDFDVIMNVVDASTLSRGLELTLELLEMEKPMILVLNMIDSAEAKGIAIDEKLLSEILNIPVVKTIGNRGIGVEAALETAYNTACKGTVENSIRFRKDVEGSITEVMKCVKEFIFNKRFAAIKLLEKDDYIVKKIILCENTESILVGVRRKIEESHGINSAMIISYERHGLAMDIFERVAKFSKPKKNFTEIVDDILMHPIWGYFFLAIIVFAFFNLVFKLGQPVEGWLTAIFDDLSRYLQHYFPTSQFIGSIISGTVNGLSAGIGIALPYIFPFTVGLSFLEDIGYLPRIAFLVDAFMHKIGLHGKSIIPLITAYGCNVPAILSTRNMNNESDKFKTAFLATFVPCSARTIVIMGLVGYYLGGNMALLIYIIDIVVIAIMGKILTRVDKEPSPGLVIEIPSYHLPTIKSLSQKTWFRLKDFVYVAFPIIIVSSVILSIIDYFKLTNWINKMLSPITTFVLGLPQKVGVTLIFGIFRKELTLIMLNQALGTDKIATVMTKTQILVFTLFIVFYIPCVSTIAALKMELGTRKTIIISLTTIVVALIIAFSARIIGSFVY